MIALTTSNIYCVWYPSGGFGHFVNAILTLHGDNFVRPKKSLEFSSTGDSHSLDLIVPKYLHECWLGNIEFVNNQNYCVLIDNGINNESDNFKNTFANATVIKICYSNHSWPVVARTMIEKAMQSTIQQQLPVDQWESDEPWTRREKYFLYLQERQSLPQEQWIFINTKFQLTRRSHLLFPIYIIQGGATRRANHYVNLCLYIVV